MPHPERSATGVPAELVDAAMRAGEAAGRDVAEVPLEAIAAQAGVSRSTLIRRLGGTRAALDEAVRDAGVDPGRRRSVRERAVDAAAALMSEHGLAAVTMDAVATAAHCSVFSLYAAFGNRGDLLRTVFEHYSPILDIEHLIADPDADLPATVAAIHRLLAETLTREPRVAPAFIAAILARPADPETRELAALLSNRMLSGIGPWMRHQIAAGRIRDLPVTMLVQQMAFPMLLHFLLRPVLADVLDDLPPSEETCEIFTQAFLRAAALPAGG